MPFNIIKVQLFKIIAQRSLIPAEWRGHDAGYADKADHNQSKNKDDGDPVDLFEQFPVKHKHTFLCQARLNSIFICSKIALYLSAVSL